MMVRRNVGYKMIQQQPQLIPVFTMMMLSDMAYKPCQADILS
jgi:hypothetical protein